jgi:hypothetical protein
MLRVKICAMTSSDKLGATEHELGAPVLVAHPLTCPERSRGMGVRSGQPLNFRPMNFLIATPIIRIEANPFDVSVRSRSNRDKNHISPFVYTEPPGGRMFRAHPGRRVADHRSRVTHFLIATDANSKIRLTPSKHTTSQILTATRNRFLQSPLSPGHGPRITNHQSRITTHGLFQDSARTARKTSAPTDRAHAGAGGLTPSGNSALLRMRAVCAHTRS